jgi:TolB protein
MRKIANCLFSLLIIVFSCSAHAILSMELTRGVAGAIPIAIVPFTGQAGLPQNVSEIVTTDLNNSGRFKVFGAGAINQFPNVASKVSTTYFRGLGTDNVAVGTVTSLGNDRYQVNFQLLDVFKDSGPASILLDKKFTVSGNDLRVIAHRISDLIYEKITGTRGIFSTRMAYVLIQQPANAPKRYVLEIADQDGYNPRPILTSPEPIMSPAWSPNGRQIAYVSFEKKAAHIYLHDVINGGRRLVSASPGINGAPAFSPDGRRLALVLSKTGSPNIYVMDIASGALSQITHDFYINTEPAFSPDGRLLLFTSNRSGGPQIYQANLADGNISRISYEGSYNARAAYTQDGKYISMIHRVADNFNIALLDLDNGTIKVLNGLVGDSSSPSLAPNGSMILYDTVYGGHNVLAMVSADGRVQLRLPARNGEAQDPAWSPYLDQVY